MGAVLSTLSDLIISRGELDQKGITFIISETEERFLSYRELLQKATGMLAELQQRNIKPGEEIVFQIEDNHQFLIVFWASILGGFIPVPLSVSAHDEQRMKLYRIWRVLQKPHFITTRDSYEKITNAASKPETAHFPGADDGLTESRSSLLSRTLLLEDLLATDNCAVSDSGVIKDDGTIKNGASIKDGDIYQAKPEDIAFIQFSSGSTGDPKGVVITHRNVLMNLTAVLRWARITGDDVGLNWMPLTHDMGLIGTHIKGLLAGINQYNMSTSLFIKRPTLWLAKASQHRATLLYSPNFGYKHFLKFFTGSTRRDWDLSAVRLIYNGAEPISLELLQEFLETMAPYGLKKNAMYPVYGLAEGTIAVTFPKPGSDVVSIHLDRKFLGIGDSIRETTPEDPGRITFVEVGAPIEYCELRICDENDLDLGENRIGYIQIRGGNVTSGYYNNPQATAAAVKTGGWVNTGDLGFLRRGQLYVTGRAKDIIFMAGQNYYSHDVERVTETVEGLELGKVAAVGVFNEERRCDELVIFVLFKQKTEKFLPLVLEVKTVVNRQLGIEVAEVIPVKSIPKTTSGKIQRYQLRERFLNGDFNDSLSEIHQMLQNESGQRPMEPLESPTEIQLAALWSEILGRSGAFGKTDNFFARGGDSLRATQLLSRIQELYGVKLEQEALFENPELGKLAAIIDAGEPELMATPDLIKKYTGNEESYPLSYAQQRLWFMDRLHHGSPQYNLASALRLEGTLIPGILERSVNRIFQRHAILRTAFRAVEGQPRQFVTPEAFPIIQTVNLQSLPEEERIPKALALAKEMAARPFRLEEAPLFRGVLYQIGDSVHILALAAHHLIFDGWSFGVFLRELASIYEELSGNEAERPETAPEPAVQYYDYCGWQMERFENHQLNTQLAYWKTQLSGKLPSLHLPLDKPRPAVQTFGGAKMTWMLPEGLIQKLRRIAREREVTLFMLLLAAFDTLLYRYTGQEEIVVGTTVANRNYRALEPLIGFFTNNLVLRAAFSGNTGFLELLARVKKVTLGAYAHQDLPFEKIVEELRLDRDLSQNPLFGVLFSLQNTPALPSGFGGLEIQSLELDNDFARFDLAVDLWENKQGLAAVFEYNTALFLPGTISRMAGHYEQLLEEIAANPTLELSRYQILTPQERRTMLQEWNNTGIEFPSGLWIKIFEEKAAENPEAIAVTAGNERLTYGELNRRANQLAHYLRSLQVEPEVVVGVYLERTVMMLVGLLGIHKAGGAYLPLDPIFPKQRIEYMLENAQAPLLLTQSSLLSTLPETATRIICLDAVGDVVAGQAGENPDFPVSPASLAYLIYTSGSTGKPKGVQIEQGALANFLQGMKLQIDIGARDRLLAVTTLSFDIAGLELFLPLIAGAEVVMANREEVISGERLIRKLDQHQITIMQATPATWRMLLESGWRGKPDLTILCGGEALPRDLGVELLKRAARVWNVYGPTETTIWSTIAELKLPLDTVSIGRPIANTQIYILDPALNPVPAGIPGELYIGGAGLARGYWKQTELTGEKFVPNPFNTILEKAPQGAPLPKLYRTGDLARWAPDGTIECLGRIDHQVKIRGYRIELGEIEAVLNQSPGVEASVVVAKELRPGEQSLVAYLVSGAAGIAGDTVPNHRELRDFLKEKLPDYMVPAAFVRLDSFPLTPNGKIDRLALPMPEQNRAERNEDLILPANEIEAAITQIWRDVLRIDRIGVHDSFFDLGGHSLLLGQVQSKIRGTFNLEIEMLELFQYPSIRTLADFIRRKLQGTATGDSKIQVHGQAVKASNNNIAIVGLSGRFPGARNITEFWRNLCDGVEAISRFSDEELLAAGVAPERLNHPQFVKAWGALEGIEKFDAAFFGYNPNEAVILDPQQRIFLEETWHALENAGYDSEQFPGRIGVFAGMGMNTYLKNLPDNSGDLAGDYQVMISNDKDFLATRVAYKLNLEGPGVTVQTACSTSLVAVHLACQSLQNGECDLALAGGVSIRLPQNAGYLYQEGMILSPDGHCRAFDSSARGTVGGNGVGVVVLKRLDEAVADGDTIYAVIKGTAVNNDGALKVGYTAPRVEGQARVIAEAQARAGVNPETITYIEAHGTGTPLGDPIEIEALTQAFRSQTQEKGFCAIGSVKTNIGHLDAAAGVSGLIKTALALYHRQIPPSLHFKNPNPKIDFQNSPFYVNARLADWAEGNGPRRAGVSSFGIGGTNAHAVLEEAPSRFDSTVNGAHSEQLLVFSAKTAAALDKMTENFRDYARENPGTNLAEIAYTLQVGRRELSHRRVVVAASLDEARAALENKDPKRVFSGIYDQENRRLVMMFPGQGSQYVNMGLELYREEPVFRKAFDDCAKILESHLGFDLRQVVYPDSSASAGAEAGAEAGARLKRTAVTQAALFTVEYATAKLWESWGVKPQAMIGHSIGEYVAACLAGVFSLEQGLALVAARGKLMEEMPGGTMLVVPQSEKEISTYLNDELSLAAANGPFLNVVSGSNSAIEKLEGELQSKGVTCRRLHTSHAFHSWMMEPVVARFTELVSRIQLNPPSIPYLSNVTGTWITAAEATNPEYWGAHLRQTVRFGAGIGELLKAPHQVLVEVGPGNTLSSLARQQPKGASAPIILSSMRHVQEEGSDVAFIRMTLGKLWLEGIKIDWRSLGAGETRRRIPLPGYPFESKPYWMAKAQSQPSASPKPEKTRNIADWFYLPVWEQSTQNILPEAHATGKNWLFLGASHPFASQIADYIKKSGDQVIHVHIEGLQEAPFRDSGLEVLSINPDRPEDYDQLLQVLREKRQMPDYILNCCGLTLSGTAPRERSVSGSNLCFYSSLFLAQALGRLPEVKPLKLLFLSNNLHKIFNETGLEPEKATLLGACRVIGQEYPQITCRSIDIAIPEPDAETELVELLRDELVAETSEQVVAYRGGERWTRKYEPWKLDREKSPAMAVPLKQGGIYLITGGLGGLGLVLAEYLAREVQAKLVLLGRSEFPVPESWPDWLAHHPETDPIAAKIKVLQSLQAFGAQVMIRQAEVSDINQISQTILRVEGEFGKINGVFHAAGNPGGGMIQMKQKEFAENVFRPKIGGALALDEAFRGRELDFFVFCSSLNAITGGFGQVDYSAANAFLDAFAQAHDSRRGTRYLSINWDRWPGVGMAANNLQPAQPENALEIQAQHPLLGKVLANTPQRTVFSASFNPESLWALSEHLVFGLPTIAGTTYLEMVRAAFAALGFNSPIRISDVLFLNPLSVNYSEVRETFTTINPTGSGADFRIISRSYPGKDHWLEHVRGKIAVMDSIPAENELSSDLPALLGACNLKVQEFSADKPSSADPEFIRFGKRWQSLRRIYFGQGEAVVEAELDPQFQGDFAQYPLHPALLDVLTGSLRLIAGGNYLPFSYGELAIHGPLTSKLFGHIRYAGDFSNISEQSLPEIISGDFDIMDSKGRHLARIRNFSMKLVNRMAAAEFKARTEAVNQVEALRLAELIPEEKAPGINSLNEGISVAEGREAWRRIFQGAYRPQIIVSTKDLPAVLAEGDTAPAQIGAELAQAAVVKELQSRPDLKNDYVAPKNEVEKDLVSIWESLLGIENIGIHDDFFELGGNSLLLVQLHTKLKEKFKTNLAAVDLYKYTSISALAKNLQSDPKEAAAPAFTEVNQRANRQKEIMKQKREMAQKRLR